MRERREFLKLKTSLGVDWDATSGEVIERAKRGTLSERRLAQAVLEGVRDLGLPSSGVEVLGRMARLYRK